MTKEELEKATGQELIEERNYCGVDGYYGDYLDNVNAEMLKRFNRLAELEEDNERLKGDLELWESGGCRAINLFECGVVKELKEQIEKMKCCGNCRFSESDTLNGTFCHREGCFVVASAICKLWEM